MSENQLSKFVGLKILLVWIYITSLIYSVYSLSFDWGYQGIHFYQQSASVYLFIYLFSIIPIPFFNRSLYLPSDYICIYIYIFTFIPAVCVPFFLYEASDFDFEYIYYLLFLLVSLLILMRTKGSSTVLTTIIKPLHPRLLKIAVVIIYVLATLVLVGTFGLKFSIPSFSEIYDVRMQYREITSGNILSRYLVFWMGYVINIFLFVIGLTYKKRGLIVFAVIYQFYIFSLMALKSHLATMVLAVILFLFFRKYKVMSTKNFILFSALLVFCLAFIDYIIGQDFFQTLVTRRILVVPSQLGYYHFEYFSDKPKTLWGYSIFKGIFDYPYSMPPPNIIGDVYFGLPQMTAVVNLFIEGFTAFGYVGIIIVTFILRFILQVINNIFVSRSNGNVILIITFLGICNILNSSSIFIILMTQGLLVHLLVYLSFPWKVLEKK